jgi:pyruvate carboxylase
MQKLLIANRGEIATRIIRAAKELGIKTVAIFAKEDEFGVHRFKADEAYLVGEGKAPIAAYLDIPDIIRIAKEHGVDAIHPGYGFLSENDEFATAAAAAGIKFVGPRVEHLTMFGDKITAKQAAIAAGVPTVPGTDHPVESIAEALAFADEFGYPLFVKSAAGGGGRGMRVVEHAEDLREAFERAASEAKSSFGKAEIYLEKYLVDPKHVEIQILADEQGEVMHLFERDSSIQRRHQKIIEFAPAVSVSEAMRKRIQDAAVKLMDAVHYQSAGTVEFLVAGDDFYFIEVNPRVQVEHTVTEEITGVDIVKSQLLIAQGYGLHSEQVGLPAQDDLRSAGVAIQSRITTEDPANNFMPDTGTIDFYRSPGGTGIRLDAGNVFAGAQVTPYFDSLLVKVIAHGATFTAAIQIMERALNEFIIRGVKTNVPFLKNVYQHPTFRAANAPTTFVDKHEELFKIVPEAAPITKLLRYVSETTVNGFPGVDHDAITFYEPLQYKANSELVVPDNLVTAKNILDEQGPEAVAEWVKAQEKVLLTDTTLRDAHQSLFATRMRTKDMLTVADEMQAAMPNLFSSEMWGGATFDTAYRFLGEDPWVRLRQLREKFPRTLTQMLFRGSNAVGYQNYPDNVLEEFIHLAAQNGMDVFRIFDSLNWLPQMEKSIQYVRDNHKIAEVSMAYSGDILDSSRTKFTRDYYVNFAKEIQAAGAHMIAIKDMAGLLKPQAAYELVSALKDAVDLPIHLHTHDTTGNGVMTYARAVEAGVDVIDVAANALSGTTSQPSIGATYYALSGNKRQPDLNIQAVEHLNDYWSEVRSYYAPFMSQMSGAQTDIFDVEMPGGQYSNLQQQAQALRLGDRWDDVKAMYATVNQMFGDIIKVTPSSKVVGDMALFMVQNDLTPELVMEKGQTLDFPQSVIDFFMGDLGQPVGGFPTELQKVVLKGRTPLTVRPGSLAEPVDFVKAAKETADILGHEPGPEDVVSYILYPQVFRDYVANQELYGPVTLLDTPTFFQGMRVGERIDTQMREGNTQIFQLQEIGEPDPDGRRTLFFTVNGTPSNVRVMDNTVTVTTVSRRKAEPSNPNEIGASMAGNVLSVEVENGETVKAGQVLLVTEAMKMETTVQAPFDAIVKFVHVANGDVVDGGDLLLELEQN